MEELDTFKTPAQRRLVFEELFLIQLALAFRKNHAREEVTVTAFKTRGELIKRFVKLLPFSLTGAQKKVLGEIMKDLEKDLEGLSQQRADRMREDLELFLEDFDPPPVEQWSSSIVDQFFLEWFIEHANPTDEDRLSMRETMLHLFKFLRVRKMLGEDFSTGSLQESEPTSPESQRTVA